MVAAKAVTALLMMQCLFVLILVRRYQFYNVQNIKSEYYCILIKIHVPKSLLPKTYVNMCTY
jgi:hypothetical protein